MDSRKTWGLGIPLTLFFLVVLAFVFVTLRSRRMPVIDSLDRLTVAPGQELAIRGRNFGRGGEGSRVTFGGADLTSASILEWEEQEIRVRAPRFDGAVLVRVKTRAGTSGGALLAETGRYPRVESGPWLPGAPFIGLAEPPVGGPGTLVTLRGERFGDRRIDGQVWVNRTDTRGLPGTEPPDLSLYVQATEIDWWSDREIRFWIPDGMESGYVYVGTGAGFSNPVPLDRDPGPGRTLLGPPTILSIRQEVVVDRVGALPGNSLYLWLPEPVPGVGQGAAATLDPDNSPLRKRGFLSLYRIDELRSGETYGIDRQIVVETREIRSTVDPEALVEGDPTRPSIAASIGTDAYVEPERVPRTTAGVVGGSRNPYTKARKIYDYVRDLLEYADVPASREVPDYIDGGLANSDGYSFLFSSMARAAGVPARPVGGFLILEDGTAREHWWAELWFEGSGWFPVDPALADEIDGIRLTGVENPVEYYWGGLDDRHVAFSRGIHPAGPVQPYPDLRKPMNFYSLQGSWEEASGNLESYRSRWLPVRVGSLLASADASR